MPHARHDQKNLKYSASRSISRVACSSVRASLRFSKKTCGVLLWSCGVCRSFKALSSRTAFHRLFCAKPLMAELVPTSSAKMSGVSIVYLAQVDTIRRSIHLAVFSRASWFTLVRLSIVCLSFYLIWCTHCRPLAGSLGSRFFHMMLPGSTTYGEATQNHPDTLSSNHHYSHYRSLHILHSFAFTKFTRSGNVDALPYSPYSYPIPQAFGLHSNLVQFQASFTLSRESNRLTYLYTYYYSSTPLTRPSLKHPEAGFPHCIEVVATPKTKSQGLCKGTQVIADQNNVKFILISSPY